MADNGGGGGDFSLKETSPDIGAGRAISGERLTSSFDLVERMQFLYVRIVRARGLPTCDSFVEVSIGAYKGRTKQSSNQSPNPDFHEAFAFTNDRLQGNILEVAVRKNDEILGKCKFDVAEVPTRVPPDSPLAPQWYKLEDRDGNKIHGEIMLSVWIGTQADEVFPEAWHSDSATITGENVVNTRSKVYLSPRLWYLRVNIIEAQDLVPLHRNRTNPELFIKGFLGNVLLRSRFSQVRSLNPIWNEDMMFVAVEPFEETLVLSVEDKVGNREECLGKCEIRLSQVERRVFPGPVMASWYNIEHIETDQTRRFAGRIHLRVSLDGGYHVLDESIQYSSDYRASAKLLWTPVIGVLELGILSASGLMPMKSRDGRGITDAYCVAKYGQKWVRTRTIVDSFSPKWNEQYTWEVYDPYTVITIGVFDNLHLLPANNCGSMRDSRIGKIRMRLSTLETSRVYTHSYPLVVLKPDGVKKMGEIQLAVRFTCGSMIDMLQKYAEPLLPQMHYTNPLSIYQLDSLRSQATHILCIRLGRNEPPIGKEVVEYMLDVGSNMWSSRRGRANFERLLSFFNALIYAWNWFDGICKWNSPTKTLLTHFAFLIISFLPNKFIAAVLLYCVVNGLYRYRLRPRHPPHMDIRLSRADSALPDELDEEFDTFPSSKSGDVLKKRYDRLRGIAGKTMMVLGDLATQGERVGNLLTWRDPRATVLFLVFCTVLCGVIFTVPMNLLITSIGFYAMRHPRLRIIDIPSMPQNFFRRLPSRAESML
ncbi:PREDICTED: FT-interacting protein 1 [Tarenaya hassleriana]|uniref:FT-interacting protein 1 n=1 Tax=Tarenaya hassleriana TaxID=28532 RepID=UPI00053C8BB7|nr:PREDICTED: FT-interacting protein 1 [Tarenaya hassleriana]